MIFYWLVWALLQGTPMARTPIYQQNWATVFTQVAAYENVNFGGGVGGASPPIAGYPQLASCEHFKVVAGGGPSGQNIVDKTDASPPFDYTGSGATFVRLGSLVAGQWDARNTGNGDLILETLTKLPLTMADDSFYSTQLILTSGGNLAAQADGTGGQQRNNDYIVDIGYFRTGAPHTPQVTWYATYYRPSGTGFSLNEIDAPDGSYTFDDGWHRLKLRIKPATITGAFAGNGLNGGAVAANDGELEFTIDGVQILFGTGIPLVINKMAASQPELYYGSGFWFGDGGFFAGADLIGPTAEVFLGYESAGPTPPTTPPTTIISSTPCCTSVPGTPSVGAMPETVTSPNWISSCTGGGTSPSASDVVLTERWDY